MSSLNVQGYSQAILIGIFQETNELFKLNSVNLYIIYQKTLLQIRCVKMWTGKKIFLYICLTIKVNHKNKSQKKQPSITFKNLYMKN